MNLPRSKLEISARTLLLVKDLVAYRLRCKVMQNKTNLDRESCDRQLMNVPFHDKGMDMVDLPRILNSKKVGAAIPNYLKGLPPIVSYMYTRTIGGEIFNNGQTVEELDVENGLKACSVVVALLSINMICVDVALLSINIICGDMFLLEI